MGAWLPAPASLKSLVVRRAGGIQGVGGTSAGCPLSAPPEGCTKSSPVKSAALDAVKRVVAEFNAIVGTRLDADGKPLPRPTVRTIMSDREGKLISHAFNEFRANASLHHNTSAPHDHDLNGIAERAIGAVSETAAALLHSANATVLEWPWLIRYAVDWHNSLIGDTGTPRPCDEIYSQANGNISRCEAIGDLPVIVRDKQGTTVQLTFTNVRCVPDFKFSLLSVKQLWNEQGIDARFCDINALVLPNQSGLIPYDPARPLSTINAVPCANVAATAHHVPPTKCPQTLEALASLGFHQVGSTSHLAKLSGVQIGALMHRRNHGGIHKIKACVHASKDGPKNLGAAVQPTCLGRVDRAAAEGAHPATRVERGLVLLVGRLEHDGAAAVAGKVHDGGQLVSEALIGRDLRVGRRVGEQVKVRRVAAGAAGIRMELEDTNRRRRMLAGGAGNEGLEGGWVQGGLPEGLVSALWHPSAVVWQVDARDVRAMGDGNGAVVVGGGWTDEES